MVLERENVFYFADINSIGGVESFFYYLSKLFKNFTVVYGKADSMQADRLSKNVEVRKWHGEEIKCKRFFGNYNCEPIIPYLDAEEKYFIIHCDYKKTKHAKPLIYPGFKNIGVSKLACRSFTELTGLQTELIYNPVEIDVPKVEKKKGLHLISATRLGGGEKGGWRMDKLSEILDKAGIDYTWEVYTNKKVHFTSPNIIIKEPKLDLTKEIAESTYLVQLSDHESFGLSVAESLKLGTPVIITDIEAFHEIGCNESNSIMLDLNMNNVDVERIKKGIPPFKYKPPKSNWGKYLDNNSDYNCNDLVEVRVLKRKFWDLQSDKHYKRDDVFKTTKTRAAYLEAKEIVEWLY